MKIVLNKVNIDDYLFFYNRSKNAPSAKFPITNMYIRRSVTQDRNQLDILCGKFNK